MSYRYRFLRFPGGLAKAVTFSYDDGIKADERLASTLADYGLKGTFNVCRFGNERTPGRLLAEEIREHIIGKGHEVAIHGYDHRAPCKQRPIEVISDVLDCRRALEDEFGMIIRGMAYPDSGIRAQSSGGASYSEVKGILESLDIAYSRTLGGDNDVFAMPTDWHAWMPTAHHNNAKIFEYIDKFNTQDPNTGYLAAREPRLFYVWGHSYEFDNADNWHHLDAICQKLSGRDDTWYATNIEIYDYVKAYESLVFSADGTRIYNPTLREIWLSIDNVIYSVKSGDTLKIGG